MLDSKKEHKRKVNKLVITEETDDHEVTLDGRFNDDLKVKNVKDINEQSGETLRVPSDLKLANAVYS